MDVLITICVCGERTRVPCDCPPCMVPCSGCGRIVAYVKPGVINVVDRNSVAVEKEVVIDATFSPAAILLPSSFL